MLYVVIILLAVVAAVEAAPLLRPDNRLREVDRFWSARRLTSAWAGTAVPDSGAGEG